MKHNSRNDTRSAGKEGGIFQTQAERPRSYVVSGLSPDHKKQQPVANERYFPKPVERRHDEIFIPSVSSLEHDDSPRSVNTEGSVLTWHSAEGKSHSTSPVPGRFSPQRINEERPLTPDSLALYTQNTKSVNNLDVFLPKCLRGNRVRAEQAEIGRLKNRFGIYNPEDSLTQKSIPLESNGMHMSSVSAGALSPMNDDISDSRQYSKDAIETIEHFSSGNSVNIFSGKSLGPGSQIWGSGRTALDAPIQHSLWGVDEGYGQVGTTIMAKEIQLARERSRKQIEALTNHLATSTPTKHLDEDSPHSSPLIHVPDPIPGKDVEEPEEDELSLKGHSVVEDYLSLDSQKNNADGKPHNPLTRPNTAFKEIDDANKVREDDGDAEVKDEQNALVGIAPISTDGLASKTRENLKNLGKYVYGHTNRKIMVAWTPIESRFLKSIHKKIELVKDQSGLSHPHKRPALYLNFLVVDLA